MSTHKFIEKEFNTLKECISYIQTTFVQETISIPVKDIETARVFTKNIPRYFYRGESKAYSSTFSTKLRLEQTLPEKVFEDIQKVVVAVDLQLQNMLGLHPKLSLGYLQHYGLPTELIDISPSLDTAIFFSSYYSGNNTFEEGYFCVFDAAIIHSKSMIIDLSDHNHALRPRLQNAFTFFHKSHRNIKSEECISDLALHWFYFKSTISEKAVFFDKLKYLPNSFDDLTASFIYMCLTNLDFKVSDYAADFITFKCPISVVPLVIESKTGITTTINKANIPYDEELERYNLYRILSNQFPDTNSNRHGFNSYL